MMLSMEYDNAGNRTRLHDPDYCTAQSDLLCGYDGFRNLASRKDNTIDMEETFTYDDMDRLTGVRLGTAPTGAMVYDGYGRMTSNTKGSSSFYLPFGR